MNLEYLLPRESEVEWFEDDNEPSTKESPSICQLIADITGNSYPEESLSDDITRDMSDIIKMKISTSYDEEDPIQMDARKNDARFDAWRVDSFPMITSTPSSLTDSVYHPIKMKESPSKSHRIQSPSLYSDPESEENSNLEEEFPQFVLDCPRKPILLLNDMNDKKNDKNMVSTDSSAKGQSFRINAGKDSSKEEERREKQDEDNNYQQLENCVKMENLDKDNELSSDISLHEIVTKFNKSGSSPLENEALKRFNFIDKCLISSLAPFLKNSRTIRHEHKTSKSPTTSQMRKGLFSDCLRSSVNTNYDISQDDKILCSLSGKNDVYSKLNPETHQNQSSRSIYSRKNEVSIIVVPMKCESVLEIKQLKDLENKYISLEVIKKYGDERRFKQCPLSSSGNADSMKNKSPVRCNRNHDPKINNQSPIKTLSPDDSTRQSARHKAKKIHHETIKSNEGSHQTTPTHTRRDTKKSPHAKGSGTIPHIVTPPKVNTRQSVRLKSQISHHLTKQHYVDTSSSSSDSNSFLKTFSLDKMQLSAENFQESQIIESQGFVPYSLTPGNTSGVSGSLNSSNSLLSALQPSATQPFTPMLRNFSGEDSGEDVFHVMKEKETISGCRGGSSSSPLLIDLIQDRMVVFT